MLLQAWPPPLHAPLPLAPPAWIFGESGNDRACAGGNASVLVGGSGNDDLLGGSGRDLLVGGQGADQLVGNADDDILVAGYTDYDNNYDALCHITRLMRRGFTGI